MEHTRFKSDYMSSIYFLDQIFTDQTIRRKIVRFAYIPKKFEISKNFFWINRSDKSYLCTFQDNCFTFWELDCSFSSIKSTIFLELNFQSRTSVFENSNLISQLYFLNEKECVIKLLSISVTNITILFYTFLGFTD